MSFQSFEELEVWKRSCQQAVEILDIVDNFTNYSLKDQMTRCSISVPSNIAEGHGRDSTKDFIRFLNYSQGSNGELRTQLYICGKNNSSPKKPSKQSLTRILKSPVCSGDSAHPNNAFSPSTEYFILNTEY